MKKPVRKDLRTLRHGNYRQFGPFYDGLCCGAHNGAAFFLVWVHADRGLSEMRRRWKVIWTFWW